MESEPICSNCANWGRTIEDTKDMYTIKCPKCNRCTYANLGVNCPAGMSVAFGTSRAINTLRMLQQQGKLSQLLTLYEKMRIREMEDKHE